MPNPRDMFESISEAIGTGEIAEGSSRELTVSSYEQRLVTRADEFEKKGELTEQQLTDDYSFARKNLQDIIESGQAALQAAIEVAAATGNPEIFASVSTLMGATADAAKKLLDMQAQIKRTQMIGKEPKASGAGPTTAVQQNVFIGSTAEMIAAIKKITGPALDAEFTEVKDD